MNIALRPIQYNNNADKENYFALQKSVAILQETYHENGKYDDLLWQQLAQDHNRVCFVIETLPEHSYCGECGVKNISDDIPEIEIELMKEWQNKGIGYQALFIMINRLAGEYQKLKFSAQVEPDNYVSQLLFEKLGGRPDGISRDYKVSDQREEQFVKVHENLLDEKIRGIAEQFGVEAKLLLTHVLNYSIDVNNMNLLNNRKEKNSDRREHMECLRNITKEKMLDIMKETLEDLEEILEAKDSSVTNKKLDEMKNKLLDRMKRIDPTGYLLENLDE